MRRFALLLVLAVPGPARAQEPTSGAYRATVLERGSRRPVFGATISLGSQVGVSGEDGVVEIGSVPAGAHRIVVEAGGYERFEGEVAIGAGERLEEVLRLTSEGENPYETVVRAERPREEVARRSLERQELRSVPGTFGDPLRVVLNLPGVARTPYAFGQLVVRGTGPDDSAVFIDGHEVPNLYHFLGGPSVLGASLIDRIDYYPGNFGPRFGRALGGVLDVGTHVGDATGWHGEAEVDLLDSSLFVEGPLAGFTVTAAARRSYADVTLPLFLPEPTEGETFTVVPIYYDYQLRVDRKLGGKDRASILFFGSDDRLSLVTSSEKEAEEHDLDTHIGFWRLQGIWRTEPVRGLTSSLSPAVGYDLFRLDASTDLSADAGLMTYRLREDLEWTLGRGLSLRGGVDLEHARETITAFAPLPPEFRTLNAPCGDPSAGDSDMNQRVEDPEDLSQSQEILRDLDFTNLAVWLEAVLDLSGGLKVLPGLRAERYSYGEVSPAVVDPRFTVRYALDDATTFKTAAGIFHQPAPEQFTDVQFGNPRLGPERSEQYAVGVERKLTRAINVDLQTFYAARSDLVVMSDAARSGASGLERDLFSNEGLGRSYGIELLVRHEPTRRLFGWISYTLARSELQAGTNVTPHPYSFDQTHNLIVVASYRLDGGWELGGRFRLTTGRPETPVRGATFDADSGGYCARLGEAGSSRGALFHQLDLRVEKTWTFDAWRFGVFLDVQNVYDAANPEATLWNYRYTESSPLRGLPFLPTLGLRATL